MAAIVDLRSLDSGISYCRTSSSLHSYSSAISTNTTDNERLTPRTFLERYSLPRVVKIVPQEPVDDADRSGLMSLLSGELLMYQQYRSGKVEASSLTKSKNGERIVSSVVIPDTYQGWFSVVTERHQVKARCYNSIQRLVSARVTVFLTMSEVVGYTQNSCRTNSDGMRQQYSKMVLKCGSVLKLLAVYQDITSESTARSKRLSWPLIGRHETNRYAQCLSSNDQVVFISVTSHGQFYAIATATGMSDDTVSKVYQLPKLLRTFPLPVRVCIVTPNKPQGSMLLENYRKEDVILTCLLDSCADVPPCMQTTEEDDQGVVSSSQFRLLEMDVDSKFYVVKLGPRELDEKRLFHSGLVQRGLRFCRENHEAWARQLKFIHHIYPRNCDDVPNVVPKKNSSKPTRKISLGDKKTVKSASFRFSTSFPEDLRPVKHPVPRKPNPKKADSKMFVESGPSNNSSYYNNDEEFYNEIYSNVPDSDNYANYPETNSNLKDLSVERLGAVNNSMFKGLGYVHYSNKQEVQSGDIQRGYEELITFQSDKKKEGSRLDRENMLKNRNKTNLNEPNANEGKIGSVLSSDRSNAFESSLSSDVTSEFRFKRPLASERRSDRRFENLSQQASGKKNSINSTMDENSVISSRNSYYRYNRTVEDVGKNFSKLMLFNDQQNSVNAQSSSNVGENVTFKDRKYGGNELVSNNFESRAYCKDSDECKAKTSELIGASGKLDSIEYNSVEKNHDIDSNEGIEQNKNHSNEQSFLDEINDDIRNNTFKSDSQCISSFETKSSEKTEILVNKGELLEKAHKTVWASPVLAENSTPESVASESNIRNRKTFPEVSPLKPEASVRIGRQFLAGANPSYANNNYQNRTGSEVGMKNSQQIYPAPIVPRTRIRTAQQRQMKPIEKDNSSRNSQMFISTAFLHPSSRSNEKAADRHTLGGNENPVNKEVAGKKMFGLTDRYDGDLKRSGNILRSSRRTEIKEIRSDADEQLSPTQNLFNQVGVSDRRNFDLSEHELRRSVRNSAEVGNGKMPENSSRLQSSPMYNNSDEVTRGRGYFQSKRYENCNISVVQSRTKRNENANNGENISKLSPSTREIDVDVFHQVANESGNVGQEPSGIEFRESGSNRNRLDDVSRQICQKKSVDENRFDGNDFKTKITIEDCRYGVIGVKNVGKPPEPTKVVTDEVASDRTVSPMYRVVRKPQPCPNIIKPFYKTRVQIGPDFSSSTDVPYSVVVDQISKATEVGSAEENIYAEIAGDSYQSPSHYFSFACERRKLSSRYDYRANGGSDGTFSNTTTSSSNADESSV